MKGSAKSDYLGKFERFDSRGFLLQSSSFWNNLILRSTTHAYFDKVSVRHLTNG